MKNIFITILVFFISITTNFGQTITSSLNVNCNVNNTDNYVITTTNFIGTATLKIEYDPTKLNYIGLGSTTYIGITQIPGSTTLSNGNKQVEITINADVLAFYRSFPIQFSQVCPLYCFGQTIATTITSTLQIPNVPDVVKTCNKQFTLQNTWTGEHNNSITNFYRSPVYNCETNEVKMHISVRNGGCHKLQNAKIQLATNIPGAVLVDVANEWNQSFITPQIVSSLKFPIADITGTYRSVYIYTFKLPCTAKYPDIFQVDAVLSGDNCGNQDVSIFTYPQVQFQLPNYTLTNSSSNVYLSNNNVIVNASTTPQNYTANAYVINSGATNTNVILTTNFPNKKIIKIDYTYTGTISPTINLDLYGCGSTPSIVNSYNLTSNPIQTIAVNTTKAIAQITNLAIGQNINIAYTFEDGTSCNISPTNDYVFNHSLSFTGTQSSSPTCNCFPGNGTSVGTSTMVVFNPDIYCGSVNSSQIIVTCPKVGDVGKYCTAIKNHGNGSLTNPKILIPISPYVTLNSIFYNGSNISFVLNNAGTHYEISPTTPILSGQDIDICYDITFKDFIPGGSQTLFYPLEVSGANNYSKTVYCGVSANICYDGAATIIKEVFDNDSQQYQLNGSGLPGVPTKYRITIKNLNCNQKINNIKIIDRLPHVGDKLYTNCDPRNSQFGITATGLVIPNTIPVKYTNSSIGGISLPAPFINVANTSNTCTTIGAAVLNTVDNTVYFEYPYEIAPFDSKSFEFEVAIPANAKAGDMACNTAIMTYNYASTNINSGTNESQPPVCYTILPPPCDNCPAILGSTKLVMSTNTTPAGNDYVIKNGTITFTTLKPIQEIKISIADLQYSWDKEGCSNCKTPAIARGCLSTINQIGTNASTGYLVIDNAYSATNNIDACNQEIAWKLGVMLKPGTYTVPFVLSLPKPTIQDCCTLNLEKFDVKLSLKDATCMVCETIVIPNTDDCCTGGYWTTKNMQSPAIKWPNDFETLDINTLAKSQIDKISYQEKQIRIANNLKRIDAGSNLSQVDMSLYGSPQLVNCESNTPFVLNEGETKIFNAVYKCNTSLENCISEVKITIRKNRNIVFEGVSGLQFTFDKPGNYSVTYTPYCGGKACGIPCEFIIIVNQDCCKESEWVTKSYQAIGFLASQNGVVTPISNGIIIATKKAVVLNLNYKCPLGCGPAKFKIREILNGVAIEKIVNAGTTTITPANVGKKTILILPICGEKTCGTPLIFYVECSSGNCSRIVSENPNTNLLGNPLVEFNNDNTCCTDAEFFLNVSSTELSNQGETIKVGSLNNETEIRTVGSVQIKYLNNICKPNCTTNFITTHQNLTTGEITTIPMNQLMQKIVAIINNPIKVTIQTLCNGEPCGKPAIYIVKKVTN